LISESGAPKPAAEGGNVKASHPYGITLNRVWTEWATNYGVSSTVAAAVFLISEARPIHEVTAKLAPDEFEQVADIVSRWPDCFPPGTPAALKSRRQTPSLDSPAVSVSTDQEPRQRHVGTSSAIASERRAHVLRAAHAKVRGSNPLGRAIKSIA